MTMDAVAVVQRIEGLPPFKGQRLRFIDFHLYWYGTVTKGAVVDQFKVDAGTARDDFKTYRELGGCMVLKGARYVATADFQPLLIEPDAERFLYELGRARAVTAPYGYAAHGDADSEEGRRRAMFNVDGPPELERRRIEPAVLRRVIQAIRAERALAVRYRSPHTGTVGTLWMSPHALSNDSFRWSARAWRSDYQRYGDVVLDRVEAVVDERPATHLGGGDADWNTTVEVRLGPHPGLDGDARRHIERQYGMRRGERWVAVRQAMLLYFLKRYQIEEESARKAPHQQPLVILNRDEVTAALPPWKRIPPE